MTNQPSESTTDTRPSVQPDRRHCRIGAKELREKWETIHMKIRPDKWVTVDAILVYGKHKPSQIQTRKDKQWQAMQRLG